MIIPAARNGSSFGLQVLAPELHAELQLDELIKGQPAASPFDILKGFREMNKLDRLRTREE